MTPDAAWEKISKKDEGLVKYTAALVCKRYHRFDIFDDLVQIGWIALWKSAQAYVPGKSAWTTYAVYAMRWAMVTEIRNSGRHYDPLLSINKFEEYSSINRGRSWDREISLENYDEDRGKELRIQKGRALASCLSDISDNHAWILMQRYIFDMSIEDIRRQHVDRDGRHKVVSRQRVDNKLQMAKSELRRAWDERFGNEERAWRVS